MSPDLTRSSAWMEAGTSLFSRALAAAEEGTFTTPTALPGWTGAHVVAHVAANATALRNLVTWARTGIETPMYASPEQRVNEITAGAVRSSNALREAWAASAAALTADLAALAQAQWEAPVRTAQGRTVPVSEVPWMRAREVMIHAVDLGTDVTMTDLPEGFLADLISEIVGKRSATNGHPALTLESDRGTTWRVGSPVAGDPVVTGSLAVLTAYVAGRPSTTKPVTSGGGSAPALPAWL